MGVSDDHLELLLIDENKWIESLEEEHLLKLQEKLNNYIYFLESKQYVERYGDNFDKKVIHITFQYSPSDNGLAFLAAVQKVLQPTDMSLKVELPEWEKTTEILRELLWFLFLLLIGNNADDGIDSALHGF